MICYTSFHTIDDVLKLPTFLGFSLSFSPFYMLRNDTLRPLAKYSIVNYLPYIRITPHFIQPYQNIINIHEAGKIHYSLVRELLHNLYSRSDLTLDNFLLLY